MAYDHYPELHHLVERLNPAQAEKLRRHALRLVKGTEAADSEHRLSFTGVGTSANPRLGSEAKEIVRRELRGVDE